MISPYNITIDSTSSDGYIYDFIMSQMPTADLSMDIKESSIIASIDNDGTILFSTEMNDKNDENQWGVLNAGDGISGNIDIYNTSIVTESLTPQKLLVLVEWK